MFNLNPSLLADFYKISHRIQYPIGSIKKSQCGLVVVRKSESGELSFDDKLNRSEFDKVIDNQMVVAFQDGIVSDDYLSKLSEVRNRILN